MSACEIRTPSTPAATATWAGDHPPGDAQRAAEGRGRCMSRVPSMSMTTVACPTYVSRTAGAYRADGAAARACRYRCHVGPSPERPAAARQPRARAGAWGRDRVPRRRLPRDPGAPCAARDLPRGRPGRDPRAAGGGCSSGGCACAGGSRPRSPWAASWGALTAIVALVIAPFYTEIRGPASTGCRTWPARSARTAASATSHHGKEVSQALEDAANSGSSPICAEAAESLLGVVGAAVGTGFTAFTILFMAFFLLLEGARIERWGRGYIDPDVQDRVERVGGEITRLTGN